MSIKSHVFGRVTLTGKDARKFKNQVIYGKPTEAAVASVKKGIKLARSFEKSGKIFLTLKVPGA